MTAKHAEAGKYADGQGLWLHKRTKQAGKWIQRQHVDGKRSDMGLGRWPDLSLGEARERAALPRLAACAGNALVEVPQARAEWHLPETIGTPAFERPKREHLLIDLQCLRCEGQCFRQPATGEEQGQA